MKSTTFILALIIALAGCSGDNIETKITEALIEISTKDLESKGRKVESLSIDSLSYITVNEQHILLDKQGWVLEQISDPLITDSSLTKYKSEYDSLRAQADKADTVKNIYRVKYHLKASTDKEKISRNRTTYLSITDLKRVDN